MLAEAGLTVPAEATFGPGHQKGGCGRIQAVPDRALLSEHRLALGQQLHVHCPHVPPKAFCSDAGHCGASWSPLGSDL